METEREVGNIKSYSKAQRKNILQALPFCEQTKCGRLNLQNYRPTAIETNNVIVRNHILKHYRDFSVSCVVLFSAQLNFKTFR
jgi:uncharacterized UBP type Zn finger protein